MLIQGDDSVCLVRAFPEISAFAVVFVNFVIGADRVPLALRRTSRILGDARKQFQDIIYGVGIPLLEFLDFLLEPVAPFNINGASIQASFSSLPL